jgi:sugar phosphate permease
MTAESQTKGFYGWWMLFFLWVVYTVPIGFAFYSGTVLYPYMTAETGWPRGEVMVGATGVMMLFGFSSPLVAWMVGRLGARVTLAIGGGIVTVVSLTMGFVGHIYPLFVLLSFLNGLGIALASTIPVQTVVISWFYARRALALGLVLGGGAIGGFLAPQAVSRVVEANGGNWHLGWFIISAASLIGILVSLTLVRNRPEDIGQFPDGALSQEASIAASKRPMRTYRTPVEWKFSDVIKTRALWLLVIAGVLGFWVWDLVYSQAPYHLRDRGFDPETVAFLYSLAIGLSIAGRFAVAALGDIIEPRYLLAFGTVCLIGGGILFWFASPQSEWIAHLYPLLCGFGMGMSMVSTPAIISNYWGQTAFAPINGLISPISVVAHAILPPIAGFVHDIKGTYFPVLVVALAGAVLAIVAILFCTPPKPKDSALNK